MGLLEKLRGWCSVPSQVDSIDRRLQEMPRQVLDWVPRPPPSPEPRSVAVVLVRSEQKFGEEWREIWGCRHVVVGEGNAQFQADRTWRKLWILVLCDVELVRVDGIFVGTESIGQFDSQGPMASYAGEVHAGVLVRVLISKRKAYD